MLRKSSRSSVSEPSIAGIKKYFNLRSIAYSCLVGFLFQYVVKFNFRSPKWYALFDTVYEGKNLIPDLEQAGLK